jgi:hypothetical protein
LRNTTSGQIYVSPSNIAEQLLKTNVTITKFTGINNESKFSTLIKVENGGNLRITNSEFFNNFSFERGGVLS